MKINNLTNQLNRIEKILTEQADKPMSFEEACKEVGVLWKEDPCKYQ